MNIRRKMMVAPDRSTLATAPFRGPIHGLLPPRSLIQPKLAMSQPGDKYEREANRVADEVMRMPEPKIHGDANREETTGKPATEKADTGVDQGQSISDGLGNRMQTVFEGGRPLPESVRTSFELRFGYDLSRVRIHTDRQAAEAAEELDAEAFTAGQEIIFGAGVYSPNTSAGRKLLTHELVHVVQQQIARPSKHNCSSKVATNRTSPYRRAEPTKQLQAERTEAELSRNRSLYEIEEGKNQESSNADGARQYAISHAAVSIMRQTTAGKKEAASECGAGVSRFEFDPLLGVIVVFEKPIDLKEAWVCVFGAFPGPKAPSHVNALHSPIADKSALEPDKNESIDKLGRQTRFKIIREQQERARSAMLGSIRAIWDRQLPVPALADVVSRCREILRPERQERAGYRLSDIRTNHMTCIMSKMASSTVDDRYITMMQIRSERLVRPEEGRRLLNTSLFRLREKLQSYKYGPTQDDRTILEQIEGLDKSIVGAINYLNLRYNQLTYAFPRGEKEVRDWILDRADDDRSIYSCYKGD